VKPDDAQVDARDVSASRSGDAEAYGRLVRRYQQTVADQMLRFTRNQSVLEELVQEVFVQAYLSLSGFRGDAPFIHWLRRIATRVGYRHWKERERDRKRREALSDQVALARTAPAETPGEAAEYLFRLLETLPPKERLVLTMHYFEGYDTLEIAAHLGWSRAQVKVRAYRARRKLRARLEAAGLGRDGHV